VCSCAGKYGYRTTAQVLQFVNDVTTPRLPECSACAPRRAANEQEWHPSIRENVDFVQTSGVAGALAQRDGRAAACGWLAE
jgi:hypothetical protein